MRLGVVLGSAGDEGFTIFLKGDRIDGVQRDPVIAFEEGNEMDSGLFQAEADAGLRLLLAQLQQPFPKGFGRGGDHHRVALASGGGDEV